MHNLAFETIKATIKYLIVALLIIIVIIGGIYLLFGQEVNETFSIISKVAIDIENKKVEQTKMTEENTLENYPEYGTQYATIKIPRINVDLPVYFGDTLEVLKKGVGHSSGSYFPGEGGSIIYMGHNYKKMLKRLGELQIGNEIKITTS